MTATIAWQQSLIHSIEMELAAEHAKLPELPASKLTWITDQIRAILENHSECSYEVYYRQFFNFCLDFRREHRLTGEQYRYALGFLVDFAVPRMTIVEGLKHKGGAWLADGLEPLEQFQTMMSEICLYPRYQLDPKKYWECWKPDFGCQDITWHDVFADAILRARSAGFWLGRVLPVDVVDLIVCQAVPGCSRMIPTPTTTNEV